MPTTLQKAAAVNNDIDLVLNAGMAASRAAMQGVSQSAVRLYLDGGPFNIGLWFQLELTPILAKTMAMAYLLGQRRAVLNVGERPTLSLDRFSVIRRMVKDTGMLPELTRLQKGYARDIYQDLYQVGAKVDAKIRFAVSQVAAHTKDKRRGLQEVKRILRTIGYDKANPYQIKTLYETAITRQYHKGEWDWYNRPAVWNSLWGFEYVTMRDDRVRSAHVVLDGTTLPKSDPFWVTYWPPNGWNCRCVVVPIEKRTKQKRPRNPPPPDEGFEQKPFTNDYNPLNLSKKTELHLDRGCCDYEYNHAIS